MWVYFQISLFKDMGPFDDVLNACIIENGRINESVKKIQDLV